MKRKSHQADEVEAFALMKASLRWNENVERYGKVC